jgi:hypothetical protein
MLIEPRLWDSTLPPNTDRTCRFSPAFSHLPLHDPRTIALDRRFSLLSHSAMATDRRPGKESGVVVDIGGPRNMVDRSTN